jgi:Cyclophilin type peptidyl-prolyl cis-trans isomerase/CLD
MGRHAFGAWFVLVAAAAFVPSGAGCKKSSKPPERTGAEGELDGSGAPPGTAMPSRLVETADGTMLAVIEPTGDANLLHPPTEVAAERAEFSCPGNEAFDPTEPDPQGDFSMDDLYRLFPDMPHDKVPVEINTEAGRIQCEVWPAVAPRAAAIFLGLATGARAWWHPCKQEWVIGEPYYDQTTFHSVEPAVKIEAGCLFRGCESAAGFAAHVTEGGAPFDKPGLMVMPREGKGGVFGILDCAWKTPEPTKVTEGRCEFEPAARQLSAGWVAFGECPHQGLLSAVYRLARVAPDRHLDPHAIHWLRAVSPTTEYYRYRPGGTPPRRHPRPALSRLPLRLPAARPPRRPSRAPRLRRLRRPSLPRERRVRSPRGRAPRRRPRPRS